MHGKNPVGIVALGPDDLPHPERRRDRKRGVRQKEREKTQDRREKKGGKRDEMGVLKREEGRETMAPSRSERAQRKGDGKVMERGRMDEGERFNRNGERMIGRQAQIRRLGKSPRQKQRSKKRYCWRKDR